MKATGRVLLPLGLGIILVGLLRLHGLAINWRPLHIPVPHQLPSSHAFSVDVDAPFDLEVSFDRPSSPAQALPERADLEVDCSVLTGTSEVVIVSSRSPRVNLYSSTLGATIARFAGRAHTPYTLSIRTAVLGSGLEGLHPYIDVSLEGGHREANLFSIAFMQLLVLLGATLATAGLALLVVAARRQRRRA